MYGFVDTYLAKIYSDAWVGVQVDIDLVKCWGSRPPLILHV